MLLDIDYHSGLPIYRQIIDQVREQILTGILKEGSQLMPVRELSTNLSINPMTVSKAYSAMESEGLLERRRGIGLFVVAIEPDEKDRAKAALIETIMRKAVLTAFQAGLPKKKIQALFNELLIEHESVKRSISNE